MPAALATLIVLGLALACWALLSTLWNATADEPPSPTIIQAALDELDALIAEVGETLKLARECGFGELVDRLCDDVRRNIIPGVTVLLCVSDGRQRKTLANCYRRLQKMVS